MSGRKMVAEAWATYRDKVLPRSAGRVQVDETRKAFYAGAFAVLSGLMGGMSESPDVEPQDLSLVNDLEAELQAFAASVVTKGAPRA